MIPQRPEVLLLAQPTQGVDEASKRDIRRVLEDYANAGTLILIASAESDEIATVCDRAYVMDGGKSYPVQGGTGFDERLLETLLHHPGDTQKETV